MFSQVALEVKNTCAYTEELRDMGFIPGWERSPGGGRHGKPTPVFLPGKSHRLRSLVGYHPWSHKESDMTEVTEHTPPEFCEYSKI